MQRLRNRVSSARSSCVRPSASPLSILSSRGPRYPRPQHRSPDHEQPELPASESHEPSAQPQHETPKYTCVANSPCSISSLTTTPRYGGKLSCRNRLERVDTAHDRVVVSLTAGAESEFERHRSTESDLAFSDERSEGSSNVRPVETSKSAGVCEIHGAWHLKRPRSRRCRWPGSRIGPAPRASPRVLVDVWR